MGKLAKGQGMSAASGAALFVLGCILVFWPSVALRVFPPLIGLVIVIVGVQGLIQLAVFKNRTAAPGLKLAQSLVNILVGMVFLAKRDLSFLFLELLFGLYVVLVAILHLSLVASAIKNKRPFVRELAESVFQLILGLLLLFSPFADEEPLWVRVLGLHFAVAGISAVIDALKLRKEIQKEEKEEN
ncbi:MAG: DUF308 domain-containing protein [Oscillospiraceae bacterium]